MAEIGPGEEEKNKGNSFFAEGKFGRAFQSYSAAIKADPNNHIYYSNRCACLLKMNKDTRALEDAEMCIQLKSDWPKGYFRKAVALTELLRHAEAILTLNYAIELTVASNLNPPSEMLSKLQETVERVELNMDKNVLVISEPPPQLVPQEQKDAYIKKMKSGTEVTLTPTEIEKSALTAWTCYLARLQAYPNSNQKRKPFVLFHTGYTADGGTGLIPLPDNISSYDVHLVSLLHTFAIPLKLQAIIIIVQKSNPGLPYEKDPKAAAWKNKKKDGVFVQVDAIGLSTISFIPIGTKKKGIFTFSLDQKEELEWDTFQILPSILNTQ